MIIVTLTLVIGVSKKLIVPLSDFMKNYAGGYVECLLETGDLPPPLNNNPNSECTVEKMRAAGRFENTSGTGGTNTGRSNSNNSNRNSNNTSNANKNNGNGSGRSGSSSGGPQPRIGSNTGADSSATGSGSGGAGSNKGDKLAAAANNASLKSSNSNGSESSSYKLPNDNGRGISGNVSIPNPRPANDSAIKPSASLKKDNRIGGDSLRKGSFTAPVTKATERDPNADLQIDLGFQYGMYIRYFMIGGLILALIIMVGTQLNSLRKSWGGQ